MCEGLKTTCAVCGGAIDAGRLGHYAVECAAFRLANRQVQVARLRNIIITTLIPRLSAEERAKIEAELKEIGT